MPELVFLHGFREILAGLNKQKNQRMQDYKINVTEIEELQMIENIAELDRVFAKAHSAIVNGAAVVLYRKTVNQQDDVFDTITTEGDLEVYKAGVYKYLAQ